MNKNRLDICGQRFGRLVALYPTEKRNSCGSIIWKCRCDCGNEVEVSAAELKKGNNKSCGCLKEVNKQMLHDRLHLVDGTCIEWLGGRKMRSDNRSGCNGIHRRKNGKYIAHIGFKKKLLYLGSFDRYEDAVDTRLRAEKEIYEGFLNAYILWQEKADEDPAWAERNPFVYEVSKEKGALRIQNSVSQLMGEERASVASDKEEIHDRKGIIET